MERQSSGLNTEWQCPLTCFSSIYTEICFPFFCPELKRFTRYQIVMTSYNIIGESPPSTAVDVSVGEAGKCQQNKSLGMDCVTSSTTHYNPFGM